MAKRRLIIVRRTVGMASTAKYHEAWREIVAAAAGAGIHAWRYRSTAKHGSYVEFIEYPAEKEAAVGAVVEQARGLDRISQGMMEEWVDATDNAEETGGDDGS